MKIICLANSYKHHERCLAGISLETKQWIRPISALNGGAIPINDQNIQAETIELLDVVEVPISQNSRSGHEVENFHYYDDQPWKVTDKAEVWQILEYREESIIHPDYGKSIPHKDLVNQAPVRSLQLIEVDQLECYQDNRDKWRCVIHDKKYSMADYNLSITDSVALDKLQQNQSISNHCLIALSLSQPWHPQGETELRCYRLVAGIIELYPELEVILTEMKRIGWSVEEGRTYLLDHFGKKSRYQLNQNECGQFLGYLRSLPTAG